MKILDNFSLNYEEIIKALGGGPPGGGGAPPAAPSAGAASAAHAASASPGGQHAAPTGAQPRQGHKYVKRTWNGTGWDYEYAGEGQAQHAHNAHYGDHGTGEHVLELAEHHSQTDPKAAYHAALGDTFKPGTAHQISHPHPDRAAAGEQIKVSTDAGGRINVHDQSGKQLNKKPLTHAEYEGWNRKEARGPLHINGPSGKPLVSVESAPSRDVHEGHLKPDEAGKKKSWKGKLISKEKTDRTVQHPDADPMGAEHLPAHGFIGSNKAEILNNIVNMMHKPGSGYSDEAIAHVKGLLDKEVANDPSAAATFARREKLHTKGQKKSRIDRGQAQKEMMDSAHPIVRSIAASRAPDGSLPPEVMAQVAQHYSQKLAPDIQHKILQSINVHPLTPAQKDQVAQDFGMDNFKTLSDKSPAIQQQLAFMTNSPHSHAYRRLQDAVRGFDPTVVKEGSTSDVGTRLDKYVASLVLKPIERDAAIFATNASMNRTAGVSTSSRGAGSEGESANLDMLATGDTRAAQASGERAEAATLANAGEYSPGADVQQQNLDQMNQQHRESNKHLDDAAYAKKYGPNGPYGKTIAEMDDLQQKTRAGYAGEAHTPSVEEAPEPEAPEEAAPAPYAPKQATEAAPAGQHAGGWSMPDEPDEAEAPAAPHIQQEQRRPKSKMSLYQDELEGVERSLRIDRALLLAIELIKSEMLVKKAVGQAQILTKDKKVDPAHQYSHMEGDEDHPRFFFRDSVGNYIRYGNAPAGHKDHSTRFGDAAIHPSEPTPGKAPQFFDPKGRKLTRAPQSGVGVQWNPNYHRDDPKNLWAGRWVNQLSGEHEHTYLDADFRENPNLKRHHEVVLTDARLPALRQCIDKLANSPHVKDNVTATALALIDQGHFRAAEVTSLLVSEVRDFGSVYKVGNRFIYPDHKLRSMLQGLTQGRTPDEPLFAVPFSKKNGELDVDLLRRVGEHYLICTLDQLGLSFNGLQSYHATQTFSREVNRLIIESHVPWASAVEYGTFAVAQELGINVQEEVNMEHALTTIRELFIDPIVLALLEQNVGKLGIAGTAPVVLPLPPPPVLYVAMNLTARTADEEVFSRWLHTFPTHLPDTSTSPLPARPNSPNLTEVAA